MSNSNFFIHFGCWNNGGCPKDNGLTKVLDNIHSLTLKPEFLSICGDNYYPTVEEIEVVGKTKKKKKKYFNIDNLISGFGCLPNDIPIYMTYGNHDYETNLYINNSTVENDCTITRNEINIVDNEFHNIKLKLFQSVPFLTNTLLLFIDTTIFDEEDAEEYLKCFKEINEQYTSIDFIRQEQIKFIETFVTSVQTNMSINNIIIVGHHPLAQFKYKNEQMNYFILSSEFNNLLFDKIYTPLSERHINYYYLCADLHQYQPGNIIINGNMHIKQYIVGTAGAKKDKLMRDQLLEGPQIISNIEYFMDESDKLTSSDENGYLICANNGTNLEFEFVKVTSTGGKRKTKKRKRRNNKTKKIKTKHKKYSRH
jgi:hypothetical protein